MGHPQLDSSTSLEWQWQSLTAGIREARAEVTKAERLLGAAVDMQRSGRSFDTWTAILNSRIARLKAIEYRYRSSRLPARFPMPIAVQHTCDEPGCLLRFAASTVEWTGRCPRGRQPIGPGCVTNS